MNNNYIIGDLSIADKKVLTEVGTNKDILEFGVGASTQLFSTINTDGNLLVSVETHEPWIKLVSNYIENEMDGVTKIPQFQLYDQLSNINTKFDVILDDGIPPKRVEFAINSWKLLKPNGHLLMHDTRRSGDINNIAELLKIFPNEISNIEINKYDSNISIITKRTPLEYVNWNTVEGKLPWMSDLSEPRPKNWKELYDESISKNMV